MSVEAYGFAIYIGTFVVSAGWLVWSFVPDSILMDSFGIIYYPSKYWAAAIPALIIVAYVSWYIFYMASVLITSQPRIQAASCKDSFSRPYLEDEEQSSLLPPLCDVPIEVVNRRLPKAFK